MSSAASHDAHEHHHRPTWHYLLIAVILGLITLIELGPLFEWFNLPVLVLIALSVLKFGIVIEMFMHLWDDENVYTQIFLPPLFGGVAMVSVMMLLAFSVYPSPREDSIPVAERWWTSFNGECNSWVRSHVSNRWYCTSPPIDRTRLALYNQPAAGGGAAKPKADDLKGLNEEQLQAKLVEMGESIYGAQCVACHQATGQGVPGVFPPLAGSDYAGYLDPASHARIIVKGLSGEIVVNGTTYNGVMAAFGQLSDIEIAAIATYERNSWGNSHGMVTPEMVAAAR